MHSMPERDFVLERVPIQRAVPGAVFGIVRIERAAVVVTWADSRHFTVELLETVSELCEHVCAVFIRCLCCLLTSGCTVAARTSSRFRGLAHRSR